MMLKHQGSEAQDNGARKGPEEIQKLWAAIFSIVDKRLQKDWGKAAAVHAASTGTYKVRASKRPIPCLGWIYSLDRVVSHDCSFLVYGLPEAVRAELENNISSTENCTSRFVLQHRDQGRRANALIELDLGGSWKYCTCVLSSLWVWGNLTLKSQTNYVHRCRLWKRVRGILGDRDRELLGRC